MEVTSEEDKSSSWGTPWSINNANNSSPCTGNFHGRYSSHQSSLHLNQLQWKSREHSWQNVIHFGTDMQKPPTNALSSYAVIRDTPNSFSSDTLRRAPPYTYHSDAARKVHPNSFPSDVRRKAPSNSFCSDSARKSPPNSIPLDAARKPPPNSILWMLPEKLVPIQFF